MHVISKRTLEQFWIKHAAARAPLQSWFRVVSSCRFENIHDLRQAFNSVDPVPPFTVFNIAGNNYRIVAAVHYNRQKLYIRSVLTHVEYDRMTLVN